MNKSPLMPGLWIAALVLPLVVNACSDSTITAPNEPLLRTPDTTFELRSDGQGQLRARVPYAYTNTTQRTVFLVNCQGYVSPSLQRMVGDQWLDVWTGALELGCVSDPVLISAGSTYADTIVISGSTGHAAPPGYAILETGATYRLNLHRAVHNYNPNKSGFGDALPEAYRISNSFTLVQTQ